MCSNVCWLPFRPVSTLGVSSAMVKPDSCRLPSCPVSNPGGSLSMLKPNNHCLPSCIISVPHHLALDGEARLSSASPLCYLIVGLVTQCVAMANAACSVATCSALPCTMLRTACFLAPRFASFLAPLLFLDNHHEPFALSPFVICSVGFRSRFHLLRSCARGRWSMQGWWFKGLGEEGRGGNAMLLLRTSRARVYK